MEDPDTTVFSGGLSTPASASADAGTYPIDQGTLSASVNYAMTFVNGTLTITPASLVVTADDASHDLR